MAGEAVQDREAAAPQESTQETSLERAGGDRPLTRTGAMGFGAAPRNFDEAWRMAGILAKSQLVPKAFFGKAEDILVAMQYGAEIGLPPMASLQSIGVINGKPGIYGDGFLGVIQAQPAYVRHTEYYLLADGAKVKNLRVADYNDDDTTAVSVFWRKGNPEPFEGTFSIGDAKRAKLWTKEGPWTNYPGRQLMWRARGYAGRNGFSAELRGIKTAEELHDTPDDVIDVAVEPIGNTTPTEPVRRSEKAVLPAPPVSDAAEPTSDRDATRAAEKPAGASKTAKAAAPAGPGQVTKNVVIMDTAYVGKPADGGEPYHEIQGVVMDGNKPGLGYTWVTRDDQTAKLAESCAGTNALFTVTWHEAKVVENKSKKAVKVITGLAAAN